MLRTHKLTKRFGAHVAVDAVDLEIAANTLHAIIGPNGAGKTTLFNLLAGETAPSSGSVFLGAREITKLDVRRRSHLGIGRSFQRTNVFKALSAFENVRIAAQSRTSRSFDLWTRALAARDPVLGAVAERARERLAEVGLGALGDRIAGELAGGDQRLLELAIALATDPQMLLLDEPSQGLSGEDALRLMERIRGLAQTYTIVLIEHNVNLVMELSDEITVMNFGAVLARGTPAEIRANPLVREAYLGRRG